MTYTIKVTSEAVYTLSDHEGTIQVEHYDIRMKAKLILTRFGNNQIYEKSFFYYIIGFYIILGIKAYYCNPC